MFPPYTFFIELKCLFEVKLTLVCMIKFFGGAKVDALFNIKNTISKTREDFVS